MNSKKLFHLVSRDGNSIVKMRYDAASGEGFNPEVQFHPVHETSNFLDMFLPEGTTYGEFSVFGSDEQQIQRAATMFDMIGRKGVISKSFPTHGVVYGDWDDHGIGILVPKNSPIKKLEDLGVYLTMKSETDKLKIRKCFRRIRAHHEWAIQAQPVGGHASAFGQVLRVAIPEAEKWPAFHIDTLHVDLDELSPDNRAMADGVHLISQTLCKALGLRFDEPKLANPKVGDAFKGTMFSRLGLGKGFFHVVDMEKGSPFGLIIYGPKKQVKFDGFFLGSLGDVKGGEARTDIQSLGAFLGEGVTLWKDQASMFINEVVSAIHNEKHLQHLFLSHFKNMGDLLEFDDYVKTDYLVLVEALRNGVPILHHPGLFRRVVRLMLNSILDCESGRIPYGMVARRYNLMPDLSCFDLRTGEVDFTKSSIPEDAVICMDANPGPFAMYRQPLGNAKEAVIATNIHNRRYRKYVGRDRVILGVSVRKQLKAMGGADFDDAVVGTDHLDWVQVIAKAEYPQVTIGLDDTDVNMLVETEKSNRFIKKRTFPCNWSMKDYFDASARATEQRLTIGPIDNAVRLDALLSGPNKRNMLADITRRLETAAGTEREKLIKAFVWLHERQDYQLADVACNLEYFIDYIKLGKGDEAILGPMIDKISEVRETSFVLPECWTYLGGTKKRPGRISVGRRSEQNYVLAPSLVCETLGKIRGWRDELLEGLKEEEWRMVQRIPESLDVFFPRTTETREEAFALRDEWRTSWMPFIAGESSLDNNEAYRLIVNGGKVTFKTGETVEIEGVRKNFNLGANDPTDPDQDPGMDHRLELAVEIARQTYRTRYTEAQKNEHGEARNFSDGLLWTNTIGLFYIKAMKEAGLTGHYAPVKFNRWSRNLSRTSVIVNVMDGEVIRKEDGLNIGHVVGDDDVPDGEYTVEDGMMCIVEPALELTESATEVDESLENPIEIDSDVNNY